MGEKKNSPVPFFLLSFSRKTLSLAPPRVHLFPHQTNKTDGRSALKTALRELEGAAAEAKRLVDSRLQRSLDAARLEAGLARAAALRAEALSAKLAFIRGRVEGTEEEEEDEEGRGRVGGDSL